MRRRSSTKLDFGHPEEEFSGPQIFLSAQKFPNVLGVFDYAGTEHGSRPTAMPRVAFPIYPQGRRPECSFRSSIAQPAGSAVYASAHTSRCAPQDSRPEWFATPSSVRLFHPLLSAGLPAHG